MCGRFEKKFKDDQLQLFFDNMQVENNFDEEGLRQNNISPTDNVLVLKETGGKISAQPMGWGIKFSKQSPLIFNSRIETIKEKPYWKIMFDKNRCIVPMSGFYEWQTIGKKKIPYRIYLPEKEIFFVPGIFHYDKTTNQSFVSLITTVPNQFISKIHHRMPVILFPDEVKNYFINSAEDNLAKCKPLDDSIEMAMEQIAL